MEGSRRVEKGGPGLLGAGGRGRGGRRGSLLGPAPAPGPANGHRRPANHHLRPALQHRLLGLHFQDSQKPSRKGEMGGCRLGSGCACFSHGIQGLGQPHFPIYSWNLNSIPNSWATLILPLEIWASPSSSFPPPSSPSATRIPMQNDRPTGTGPAGGIPAVQRGAAGGRPGSSAPSPGRAAGAAGFAGTQRDAHSRVPRLGWACSPIPVLIDILTVILSKMVQLCEFTQPA